MEGRSIIHKMHVLERSFLPELKYSTNHSCHPLPGRSPVDFVSPRVPPSQPPSDTNPIVVGQSSTLLFTPIPRLVQLKVLSLAGCDTSCLYSFAVYEPARSIDPRIAQAKSSPKSQREFCDALDLLFALRARHTIKYAVKIIYQEDL